MNYTYFFLRLNKPPDYMLLKVGKRYANNELKVF